MGEGWLQVTVKNQRLLIHFFYLHLYGKVRKGYLWNGQIGNQTENEDRKQKMSIFKWQEPLGTGLVQSLQPYLAGLVKADEG